MKFEDFELNDDLLDALHYMGFDEPTPIQLKVIPQILEGKDIIACAQTGTGKTAAFVLPILEKLARSDGKGIRALIMVPTRELAVQIDRQIQGFSYFLSVESIAIYGGGDPGKWETQKSALIEGVDIIVATPGKLISHLNMGYVNLKTLEHLILDEADRMLDMNFFEPLQKIISFLGPSRQTAMFSATMSPKIRKLADKILTDPSEVTLELSKPAEGVLQAAYLAFENQKIPVIKGLIADKPNYERILIFTSTKKKVSEIARALRNKDYEVAGISSNLDQDDREKVLMKFRAKRTRVLVATDVLSRGIDIKDINLIINFDVPNEAEDYVHRIGRTARAKTTGVAITLINQKDMYKFAQIEKLIQTKVGRALLPKELGTWPKMEPEIHKAKRQGTSILIWTHCQLVCPPMISVSSSPV